jgi:hypothetical protein
MYMNDPETFAHTAKFWTDCYASAKGEDDVSTYAVYIYRLIDYASVMYVWLVMYLFVCESVWVIVMWK